MDADLERAAAAMATRDYPVATSCRMKYLRKHPNDAKVLEEYIATIVKMPHSRKEVVKMGPGLGAARSTPAAIFEECLGNLEIEPHNLDSLNRLGKAAMESRWYETAVFAFFTILQHESNLDAHGIASIKSNLLRAVFALSENYLIHRRFDEACDLLRKARALSPTIDLDKRLMEAEIRGKDARIDRVRKELAAGGDAGLEQELKDLEHERSEFMAGACRDLLKTSPSDAEIHIRLGEALYYLAQEQNDINMLRTALTHIQFRNGAIPDHCLWQSSILMGKCLLSLGMPKLGDLYLSQFLASLPYTEETKTTFLEGYRQLGIAREAGQDFMGALQAYLKVIEKDIEFADVLDRAKAIEHTLGETDTPATPTTFPAS